MAMDRQLVADTEIACREFPRLTRDLRISRDVELDVAAVVSRQRERRLDAVLFGDLAAEVDRRSRLLVVFGILLSAPGDRQPDTPCVSGVSARRITAGRVAPRWILPPRIRTADLPEQAGAGETTEQKDAGRHRYLDVSAK